VTDSTWFADETDARAYLGEVARLWGAWAVGLTLLLALQGGWVLLVALLLAAAMVWLGQPIQRRARALDHASSRGGRAGDDAARELAYGEAPLRAALDLTGASPNWVWARRALVIATIAGFVIVVVTIVRS
jgi:hypothetical protein